MTLRPRPVNVCPWRGDSSPGGGCQYRAGHTGKHRSWWNGSLTWETHESWNFDGETEWDHAWLDRQLAAELELYKQTLVW